MEGASGGQSALPASAGGVAVSTEANKTCVLRHFEELWNHGQLDKVADFFSEDFMNFGNQYQDSREIVRRVVKRLENGVSRFALYRRFDGSRERSSDVRSVLSGDPLGRVGTYPTLRGADPASEWEGVQGQAHPPFSPEEWADRGAFCRAG